MKSILLIAVFNVMLIGADYNFNTIYGDKAQAGMLRTQILSDSLFRYLKVSYIDSVSNPGKITYRQLKYIGSDPYWSKPCTLDIEVGLGGTSPCSGNIEINIEELWEPEDSGLITSIGGNYFFGKRWVINKVLFNETCSLVDNKILLHNVEYNTINFISSSLFIKDGFRITAMYIPNSKREHPQMIKKEFYYDE